MRPSLFAGQYNKLMKYTRGLVKGLHVPVHGNIMRLFI